MDTKQFYFSEGTAHSFRWFSATAGFQWLLPKAGTTLIFCMPPHAAEGSWVDQ